MPNQLALVTGSSGGLGSELSKLIAARGIRLLFLDRDPQKGSFFADQLNRQQPQIVAGVFAADLADHADLRRVAREITTRFPAIDFLFNNAGILTENLQFSRYGNELHFEVNTLAPLQLIDLLRPALRAAEGATIVNTSAGLSLNAKTLNWNELLHPSTFKKLYGPYVNSKAALNVITSALSSELAADKITIRAADPGPNKTRLTKGAGTPLWMRLFYWALPGPQKGAQRILDAALSPKWGDRSGIFISNNKVQQLPPALAGKSFQQDFLTKCRELALVDRVGTKL